MSEELNKKINDELKFSFERYRKSLVYLQADIPIQALCLPKEIENILLRSGCLRIFDVFDRDLSEIKGLGDRRLTLLTSRLDEFLAVGL